MPRFLVADRLRALIARACLLRQAPYRVQVRVIGARYHPQPVQAVGACTRNPDNVRASLAAIRVVI